MRILHLINTLGNGGAENLIVNLLSELNKKEGVEIELLVLSKKGTVEGYYKELRNNGLSVKFLTDEGSLYSPNVFFNLVKFIRRNNFDIIHSHLFPAFYYLALIKKLFFPSLKIVFTEHSFSNNRINKPIFKFIEKGIYKEFNLIVCISKTIQDVLESWVGKHNFMIIRNGLDLNKFEQFLPFDLNSKLKLAPGTISILMVARFNSPKRQDLLIEALSKLPKNYVVLFAGEGSSMESMKIKAAELNLSQRVFFLGQVADAGSWMKSASLNVLCSNYEGMSGVAVESLASNKPFIGSDVPGINDVVNDKNVLFENNIQSLVDKIKFYSETNVSQLLLDQRVHAMEYSIDRMVNDHLQAYNSINI